MPSLRAIGFAGALALGCAAPALAQDDEPAAEENESVWDRGCGDDNGTDRCDPEIQARMLSLYGWDTAQELVDGGVQFRRFMMVDGYGRDLLGLAFERRPGASPRVVVQAPDHASKLRQRAAPSIGPLAAAISQKHWDLALSLTENFDQRLARETDDGEGENGLMRICLHAWFTVVEAGDPALVEQQASKLRSDAEDACADGLSMAAAFQLAELALDALHECHGLDLANFRNRIMLLNTCAQLGGDRIAAAEVSGTIDTLRDHLYEVRQSDAPLSLDRFFDYQQRASAAELAQRLQGAALLLRAPVATDAMNAYVEGQLSPSEQPPEETNTFQYADIRLTLRKRGSDWTIASFEISDMKTVAYDDEE